MTEEPSNAALDFLQQIQNRRSVTTPPTPTPTVPTSSNWTRIEILPGLEIHIRQDFIYPNNPGDWQNLFISITQKILDLYQNRRSSP